MLKPPFAGLRPTATPALALVLALALAACATKPTDKTEPPARSAAAQRAPSPCLKDTGSRIPRGDRDCTGIGRSYSRDDIDRTGATDAASALRLLDPSITVHGP